jgi:AcrR family transcriptional regulator
MTVRRPRATIVGAQSDLTAQKGERKFIAVSIRSQPPRRAAIRERAREAAAEAILDAAEEVAAERGLEATSTAAIAERAGVAVGTLYNYFPDRESLLSSLFKVRRTAILPRINAAAEAAKHLPFEQRLRTFVAGVIAVFDDYRRFLRVVISADQGAVKIQGRTNVIMPKLTAELEDILGSSVGEAASFYARMLLGGMKGVLNWHIELGQPLGPDADRIVDTFLRGIPR